MRSQRGRVSMPRSRSRVGERVSFGDRLGPGEEALGQDASALGGKWEGTIFLK